MKQFILGCLLSICMCSHIFAAPAPIIATSNMIYIVIDGVDRDMFYTLLQKSDQLPNIQKIIQRGNYRNVETAQIGPSTADTYTALITGYYDTMFYDNVSELAETAPAEFTLFYQLKQHIPSLNIGAIVSEPQNPQAPTQLSKLFADSLQKLSFTTPEKPRTAPEVTTLANVFLTHSTDPYFLFLHFTDAEEAGRHHGVTSNQYLTAIQQIDTAIGELITPLEQANAWNKTQILLTTNYGLTQPNMSWIAATFPIRYKGTELDIVPTIYRFYKIPWQAIVPPLEGKPLIY